MGSSAPKQKIDQLPIPKSIDEAVEVGMPSINGDEAVSTHKYPVHLILGNNSRYGVWVTGITPRTLVK
jgi:hypothetical protein